VKPQDYKAGGVYQSHVQQQLADCERGSIAVIQRLLYSEPSGGNLLESSRFKESEAEFFDPAPGTFLEAALKYVCRPAERQ
jgi:hypothetical protein